MKKKENRKNGPVEIFLLDQSAPIEMWDNIEESRPDREEVLYGCRRLEEGKGFTFIPFPAPHVLAFYPQKSESRSDRLEQIRIQASDILAFLKAEKFFSVEIVDTTWCQTADVLAFMEGLYLGAYKFEDFRNKKTEDFSFGLRSLVVAPEELEKVEIVSEEVKRSRHLIDLPFVSLNAADLALWAKKGSEELGIRVKIWSDKELAESGMGGLLGVNRGSVDKPSFTEMEYKPAGAVNKKPVVLVGKGVVFDAGGMNIKTGSYMDDMKTDMAGAAVAMGIVRAVAALRLPVHVRALLPATDNRLNGNALVCGDIIDMYDGTTVEITNTDAEGRLLLADAVAYARKKFQPELLVSIATLTGAASRALGSQGIAAMQQNADPYVPALCRAGESTYERLCFFPMWKEYGKELESSVADLKNCGNGPAGMITAAKFVQHFAGTVPFVHLDVAGVEFLSKRSGYRGPGATAYGIRLMVEFLRDYSGGSQAAMTGGRVADRSPRKK